MVEGKSGLWSKQTTADVQCRIATYWAVGLGLTVGYILLALMVGVMALVRFYSKKDTTFPFIGTGFLG